MAIGKNFKQGVYKFPYGNREKCKNNNKVTYRSSWELYFMNWLSRSPNIIEWISEYPIPYMSQVKGRMSRYYVDFIIKYRDKNGNLVVEMIEVKPEAETKPNKRPKTKTAKSEARYVQESLTYINNQEKWTAAQKYADERGWKFRILTENQLFKG